MAGIDHIATRDLWCAVRNNDARQIKALVEKGADIHVQGSKRVVGRSGTTVGRDSLIDHAIENHALRALENLLDLGIRLHPSKDRGSEFSRACGENEPWMEGVKLMFDKRKSLTACSHRDKDGWGPLHWAISRTRPIHQDDKLHPLVEMLLTRLGKWEPKDTAILLAQSIHGRRPVSVLNRFEKAGIPLADHLAQSETAHFMWSHVNMNTYFSHEWEEWTHALLDRGIASLDDKDDPINRAKFRAARASHGGVALPLRERNRCRP